VLDPIPSTGIPYVIVNGRVAVDDSKFERVNAGHPIRYAPEKKGRHLPANREQWLRLHTVKSGGVPTDRPGTSSCAVK
jgi:hypothetical protein